MKRVWLFSLFIFLLCSAGAQVNYYKGEWTTVNKSDLFSCICRVEIMKNIIVKAEFAWTYLAIDSTDANMTDLYQGKKGRVGIEYAEGIFDGTTKDLVLIGKRKDDPYNVIGISDYFLKLSPDKKVLYGKTSTENIDNGLFYAIKINSKSGAAAIKAAKLKLKKKSK